VFVVLEGGEGWPGAAATGQTRTREGGAHNEAGGAQERGRAAGAVGGSKQQLTAQGDQSARHGSQQCAGGVRRRWRHHPKNVLRT
jgi:hypothetical protein